MKPTELQIDDAYDIFSEDFGVFDLEWDGRHGVLFPVIYCVALDDKKRIKSTLESLYPGSLFGLRGPAWEILGIWKKYRDLVIRMDDAKSSEIVWGRVIDRGLAEIRSRSSSENIWNGFSQIEKCGYMTDVVSERKFGYRGIGYKFRDRYMALSCDSTSLNTP